MLEKKYTKAEIKQAFWDNFHKSGGQWFDYLSSEEDNEECTKQEWKYFEENLDD